MLKTNITILIVFFSTSFAQADKFCDICPDRGNESYALANVVYIDTVTQTIVVELEYYFTDADNAFCNDTLIAKVIRDCTDDMLFSEEQLIYGCGAFGEYWGWCGSYYDSACEYYNHIYFHKYKIYHTFGKGTLELWWGARRLLSYPFNFTDPGGYGKPTFHNVRFLNRDYSTIYEGDIFDAQESVAIMAEVTWENEVAPAVRIILRADNTCLEIGTEALLASQNGHTGIYRVLLPPGALLTITGDPENLSPIGTEIMAFAEEYNCEGGESGPKDVLHVVNYILHVEQISFLDDFQLYRDSTLAGQTPELIKINDPVWLRDGTKNEPIAYKMGTQYNIKAVLRNIYHPSHNFQYVLKGFASYNGELYSTDEYQCNMAYSNYDTVSNMAPMANIRFPDAVGIIDSLKFNWVINKQMHYNFDYYQFLNSSGPHKIFLTYDTPLLDTVNTLALDKICRYAQDESVDTSIVKSAVKGLYNEGWHYVPWHEIFNDPLDVIRTKVGQCGDYANIMTELFKSIGMPSNSIVIYNEIDSSSTKYVPFWIYSVEFDTTTVDTPWVAMLTNMLISCDGDAQNWQFNYHAVSRYQNYLCDASLGIFTQIDNYDEWWKYYLHPRTLNGPFSHNEPPSVPPFYYNWYQYIPGNNQSVLPFDIFMKKFKFKHP